ncbi:MAG: cysteine synthase A [Alloprevotella sp.]|jgi:cysteine synthase A|nr:MAG: cysteine synthase A [Alloprevotella sp.]
MSKIASSALALVGHTPLVETARVAAEFQLKARVLVKLESFNPAGSVKDRTALAMIEAAEREGKLSPGATIVEATSGNTGVGLAFVAAIKGYKAIIVMPETMSIERRRLVAAYGAEVVLTPGAEGMKGALAKAEEIRLNTPGAVTLGQFVNPANPQVHFNTTGVEIAQDTQGEVDILVAGVGTGGTVSGAGFYLKTQKSSIRIVAVEPTDSPVLSGGQAGAHKIQGIGAGFIPETYNPAVVDEVMQVTNEEAYEAARLLGRKEGILCGVSSGAAFHAAISLAQKPENEGKTIVAILPDTGERYLSTPLFGE